jgi:DNA repair protein RadC
MENEKQTIKSNGVSEVSLVYRTRVNPKERAVITSSKDAYQLLFESWNKNMIEFVEEIKIMLLNRSNKVLGIGSISMGSTTGSIFDVKHILQFAIKANACGIIVSHNHPSGNREPSDMDISGTRKLKDACSLVDLNLLDHLIISPIEGYYSFADEGMM